MVGGIAPIASITPVVIEQGADTGTAVSKSIQSLRSQIAGLQQKLVANAQRLNDLRGQGAGALPPSRKPRRASPPSFRSAPPRGNPELVSQWNVAQSQLDALSGNINALNALGTDVTNDSSTAHYALDQIGVTFNVSGAVDEDHRQLRILEDETNQTIVLVDRLLKEVSDDVQRQTAYVASERANLTNLASAIKNGEIYSGMLGTPVASNLMPGSQIASSGTPLVVIRFDHPDVDYQQILYAALNQALQSRPSAGFEVVAVSPTRGNAASVQIAQSTARRHAQAVMRSMTDMGVPALAHGGGLDHRSGRHRQRSARVRALTGEYRRQKAPRPFRERGFLLRPPSLRWGVFPAEAIMKFARILLVLAFALAQPATAQTLAKHEMIAAANPLAAQAGLQMMKAGGSAVDAAIATQLVLNLVEPESSGIGGGAFMLVHDAKTGTTTSFDGRELAPASATPGMFLGTDGLPRSKRDAIPGGLSVGVPGVVAMLEMAHKKYGRLPWAKLFEPAIKLAEGGFPVGKKLANTIARTPQLARMPDIRRSFYHPDGTAAAGRRDPQEPRLGRQPQGHRQGRRRRLLQGAIADAIVAAVHNAPQNQGGMTARDLANYKAVERAPVCGAYRVWHLCSMGPPSSGGVAIVQIMGMLQHFPSSQLQPGTLSAAHLFAEASRLAYADRAKYLADTDFVPVPVKGLTDTGYIAGRASLIDPARDMGTAQPGNPPEKHAHYAPQVSPVLHGTSHMTIVDRQGEVVAMTTSVESVYGAQIMAGGFLLNNTLTDFSLDPTLNGLPVANAPAPGKRPLSAMSPTIVFDKDGHFLLSVGSPGGPAIIDYVAQTLIAMLDGGLSPQAAIDQPRELNLNGPTMLEQGGANDALAPGLAAMGHTIQVVGGESSGLHGIKKTPDGYVGGADPRRDGVVLGD